MVISLKRAKLLVGVLVLVLTFSGLVSARPQADVSGWTAIDMFVRYQIDVNKAWGTSENSYFVDELTQLVLQNFDEELDARIAQYAGNLTPEQMEQLKYLLVSDYVSYLYQKSFYPKNAKTLVVRPIKVASIAKDGKTYDYYYAPMSSSIPYPIHWWVQVKVDLTGGHGMDSKHHLYWVNGNNNISKIVVKWSGNDVTYEIHFYDEDYPIPRVDQAYDKARCHNYTDRDSTYGCEDIESIEVLNGKLIFHSDWSNDQTYATYRVHHLVHSEPYKQGVVIYVSNTWDHLMATFDTNPDMAKNWGYTAWN